MATATTITIVTRISTRLRSIGTIAVDRYYETNQYGADLLRQAVNYGYEQGFRAGEADRQDRWHSNYQGSFAYQDANYGYTGYYVDQDEYNYYFRQGFRHGYEDGFNSRYQYGQYSNGSYIVLEVTLRADPRLPVASLKTEVSNPRPAY